MKGSELKEGTLYRGKNGKIRKIMTLWNFKYGAVVWESPDGKRESCTRVAFCRWLKEVVNE